MDIAVVGLARGAELPGAHCHGFAPQWGLCGYMSSSPKPRVRCLRDGQPDYLILNTPCGQVSLYPWQDEGPSPKYAVGLHEWVTAVGYRWVGDTCRIDPSGREISRDDYIPRRLMVNTCSGSTRRSWRRHPRR